MLFRILLILQVLMLVACSTAPKPSSDTPMLQLGKAKLRSVPSIGDSSVPEAKYRNTDIAKRAAPTNQWYSSIMYQPFGDTIYAVPVAVKPSAKGFEFSQPVKQMFYPADNVEVHYLHTNDLQIRLHDSEATQANLADYSDWAVSVDLIYANARLKATVAHGSPYAYFEIDGGDNPQLEIQFDNSFIASQNSNERHILYLNNSTKSYALYALPGSSWQSIAANKWLISANSRFVSVAALPNQDTTTLAAFKASAYNVIRNTVSRFSISPQDQAITTHFQIQVEKVVDNTTNLPIIGLYPHHYHKNASLAKPIASMQSIRGPIQFYQLDEFNTVIANRGFTPIWPAIENPTEKANLLTQLGRDTARANRLILEIGEGPYWQGKGLQRLTQLMNVAYANNQPEKIAELLNITKKRAESWFNGKSSRTYFHYDALSGTIVSYPEEYDAVKDINDHHFHYGYWIRAAAEIGMQNPQWLASDEWGQMLDSLIDDIAYTERGSDRYPFIRNFDVYEGHSWASGIQRGPFGNNQESSSEAINAWAALMMYGAVKNRPDLVQLGQYLYNTEITAANYYWFDVYGLTFPDEYFHEEASILFGAKTVHYTWWTDEPRQIHGINLLPITQSSTYLGEYPNFVMANLASLAKNIETYEDESFISKMLKPPSYLPRDIWQDLFAKYLALVDPEAGLQRYDQWGSFELGETRSHALNWFYALQQLGTVDFSQTSDYPFATVFVKNDKTTYLGYNFSDKQQQVRFSNGVKLTMPSKGLHSLVINNTNSTVN